MNTGDVSEISEVPGLKSLWAETIGNPHICIAVLDGPIEQSHPCFEGAQLTQLQTLTSGVANKGSASQHGTHVTSILFGQHGSPVQGIAPDCRGLIVPVFTDGPQGSVLPCSQLDLARAIEQAVQEGANIINISGGYLTSDSEADPWLAKAVSFCAKKNVLIVAAAGNDGCECLHVPAAVDSVLAVGAMDSEGNPLEFSNWGETYQIQGILAPGDSILGALPSGGTALRTGTSFATPIVSGIVALLLSIQLKRGEKPDSHSIRDVILKSALPCNQQKGLDSRRCLVGSLNIPGAQALINKRQRGEEVVSEQKLEEGTIQPSEAMDGDLEVANLQLEAEVPQPIEVSKAVSAQPLTQLPMVGGEQVATTANQPSMPTAMSMGRNPMNTTFNSVAPSSVNPSECASCAAAGQGRKIQLVYALGELGTDYGTEARRDSFIQAMPESMSLMEYLNRNPWEAQSLIWTLNLDATPIYACVPAGSFASLAYERLCAYLQEENIERVSIPGYIGGSVRLLSGQIVPAIIPEMRGMYSWSVSALIDSLMETVPEATRENVTAKIREYLNRIYYEYRNLGVTPEDRALNFSATNAFQVTEVMTSAAVGELGLDKIEVEKSPICRPDSDCYDVKLKFFNLENNQRAGKIYRFTIDVSDVIPVTVGPTRSWSVAS